jgi:hypothetical protein
VKKIVLAICMLPCAGVLADDFKMKPGLWEVKVVRQVMDGRDMTSQLAAAQERAQQAMANLSPEQRKQMEAMMGGRPMPAIGAGGATRICVSPAMAARDTPTVDPQGQCQTQKMTRSGNTMEFEFKCTGNGRSSAGKGKRTVGGDTVTTSVDMTATDARGEHKIQNESQMTFVGADCQGVKPIEDLSKGAPAPGP